MFYTHAFVQASGKQATWETADSASPGVLDHRHRVRRARGDDSGLVVCRLSDGRIYLIIPIWSKLDDSICKVFFIYQRLWTSTVHLITNLHQGVEKRSERLAQRN